MEKVTKKDRAFVLFNEGKLPISPEVKALGLKGATRYNYYYAWQKQQGIPTSSSEGKEKGKVISELEMVVPVEEKVKENGDKVNVVEDEGEDEGEPETHEPEEKKEGKPGDGKRPPMLVAGQGHTYVITISTKTVMFYQFAASQIGEELNLGDFIDVCVEDTYKGRGLDLGLVKIGGQNG